VADLATREQEGDCACVAVLCVLSLNVDQDAIGHDYETVDAVAQLCWQAEQRRLELVCSGTINVSYEMSKAEVGAYMLPHSVAARSRMSLREVSLIFCVNDGFGKRIVESRVFVVSRRGGPCHVTQRSPKLASMIQG
jgi:hypothetical protein